MNSNTSKQDDSVWKLQEITAKNSRLEAALRDVGEKFDAEAFTRRRVEKQLLDGNKERE